MKVKKKTLYILVIVGVLLGTGIILGLNGWFGGGSSIPKDTFTRGLVGYWSFDEGSGTTAYDASGNGNDGVWGSFSSTTDEQVGAGADDAEETDQETLSYTANTNTIRNLADAEYAKSCGARWQISVPQGATINSAYASLYIHDDAGSGGLDANIYFHNTDNAGDFNTNGHIINTTNRPRTSASMNWALGSLSTYTWYNSPDIKTVVQEVVTRAGWASNQYMVALFIHNGTGGELSPFRSYDENSSYAPKLHIEYTVPALDLTWLKGKVGEAVEFDGTDDYVDVGDVYDGVKSVEFWVKTSSSTQQVLDLNGSAYVALSSNDITATGWTDATIYVDGKETSTITADTWHHVVITTETGINASTTYLGKGPDSYFDGLLDEVRFYNRPLSHAEVRYHYNRGGPVAHWKFDEGNGTITYDSTDNDNDGTLGDGSCLPGTNVCPSWVAGKYGSALSFDGTNDYVDVADNNSLDITDAITLEAWVKNPSPGGAYEDFSTFTEVDPYNWLTVTSTVMSGKVDWTGFKRGPDSDTMLYYDKGVNYFDGDFEHLLETYVGPANNSDETYFWAMTNVLDDIYDLDLANEDGLFAYWWGSGENMCIRELDGGTLYSDCADLSSDVPYYLKIKRDEATGTYGVLYCYIYTDAGRTNLFDTLSLALNSSKKDYRYIFGILNNSYGSDTGGNDGYMRNLDLQEGLIVANGVPVGKSKNAYQLQISEDSSVAGYINNQETVTASIGQEWHHVALTYDRKNIKLYVDGKEKDSYATTSAISTNSNNLKIGENLSGIIDDIRIYNYARTPDEIKLDYNAGFAALFGPKSSCDDDPGACMTQGLVGYWSFDEGTGQTVYDGSEYSNDGILNNSPRWTTGKFGGALEFDEASDRVAASTTGAITSAGALNTVTFWMYWSGTDNQVPVLVNYNNYGLWLRTNCFGFNTGNDEVLGISSTVLVNKWVHVAAIFYNGVPSASNSKLYINGVEQNISYCRGSSSWSKTIGGIVYWAGGIDTYPFTGGKLDEARIYNRALSAAEIRYHYNRGGPVGHWKFDEGNGTTTYDSAENNNDASFSGSPDWVTGKHGSALYFSGSIGSYNVLSAGSLSAMDVEDYTITAWIKRDGTDNDNIIDLQMQGSPNADYYKLLFQFESPSFTKLKGYVENDGNDNSVEVVSNTTILPDQWYHATLVFESGESFKIYVNGVLDASVNTTITAPTGEGTNTLFIGRNKWTDEDQFDGYIDDVRIYNYARTPAQILQDYNAGFATYFK